MSKVKKQIAYPFIWAWGRHMGSQHWYIEGQVHNAEIDGAPQTATYKADDGSWHTIDDCKNVLLKAQLEREVAEALAVFPT